VVLIRTRFVSVRGPCGDFRPITDTTGHTCRAAPCSSKRRDRASGVRHHRTAFCVAQAALQCAKLRHRRHARNASRHAAPINEIDAAPPNRQPRRCLLDNGGTPDRRPGLGTSADRANRASVP